MYEGCRGERRTDRQLVVEVKGTDVGDLLKNFCWPRLPFIRYFWPSFVKYGLSDFFFHAGCQESRAQSRIKMFQAMRLGRGEYGSACRRFLIASAIVDVVSKFN